jgi:hypothetical protein
METPEQADIRRINNAKNMASWRSSSERIRITQHQNELPLISRYVETKSAKQKAFSHMMKTKIGNDEVFLEEVWDTINKVIEDNNNGMELQIPIYEQCHQANVCVCCDRFICGTEEINWIHKRILLQQKC